ncbi:MAG: phospho-sugar mutase [Oscillospiraceae bacterium]
MQVCVLREFERWKEFADDPFVAQELEKITGNLAAIEDRFWSRLAFGTGGLRGVMGAGTNRMNCYTVGQAAQGLANFLKEQETLGQSVCIGYDTRRHSFEFACCAAGVLCGNGIAVHLFCQVQPTPMLSFAVRSQKAGAGIVITASHNPKQYNGFKVYGPDGVQATDAMAEQIRGRINGCDLFTGVHKMNLQNAEKNGLLHWLGAETEGAYYNKVVGLALRKKLLAERAAELEILYTPLHGTGSKPVPEVLRKLGFGNVNLVAQQAVADGDFSTVPYPNPEEPAVYRLALQQAGKTHPDLILATDPDCDRVGVMAKNECGEYVRLSGNQVGALLCEYILAYKASAKELLGAAIVKTIVTTDLAKAICGKYGVYVEETLTGFKYIGELAQQWAENGSHNFMFGFEESCGYLAGDFVRDKDAVFACALVAEMALYHKTMGQSLPGALRNLYEANGYYADKLFTIEKLGQSGQKEIARVMNAFRSNYATCFAGENLLAVDDFLAGTHTEMAVGVPEVLKLPKSNVLKFSFGNGWLVLRPSGTEPKLKVYISVKGTSLEDAQAELEPYSNWIDIF